MTESVLAHLALNFSAHPENIATERGLVAGRGSLDLRFMVCEDSGDRRIVEAQEACHLRLAS